MTEKAIFAAGCFWGVQYLFDKNKGVKKTTVGYTGGHSENPSYEEVCSHKTGHTEALEVEFDPSLVSFEELTKLFFEIHDFTQTNGQGPDIGPQYLSKIFYVNEDQQKTAQKIKDELTKMGHKVATEILPVSKFFSAEDYHQKYYEKKGGEPYCHIRKRIF